jgi:hypothetical protein
LVGIDDPRLHLLALSFPDSTMYVAVLPRQLFDFALQPLLELYSVRCRCAGDVRVAGLLGESRVITGLSAARPAERS